MALTCREVYLPQCPTGVVVRPPLSSNRGGSGTELHHSSNNGSNAPQALVFFPKEVRELQEAYAGAENKHFGVSAQPLWITGQITSGRQPVYEPTTDCVFFVDGGSTIKRLDRSNTISLVAGREGEEGDVDGPGEAARFERISSLAADGKGNVFIAEANAIRVLDVCTGGVKTLQGSAPVTNDWTSLAYDADADSLVAATSSAVCRFPPLTQCSGGDAAAIPELVAGSWTCRGNADGGGSAARFSSTGSVVAGAGGTVLVADRIKIRSLSVSGTVTTTWAHCGLRGQELIGGCQLAILPGGELACAYYNGNQLLIFSGGGGSFFTPSSEALAGRIPVISTGPTPGSLAAAASELANCLLAPACVETAACSSTSAASAGTGTITVTTGGGKTFLAHRSALTTRSEYFRSLLAAGGPFADSGATEVSLPDAHPEAFGYLLSYMYTGMLVVLDELLRPAAELAGLLLLPVDCISELQARVMAMVTPETAISNLIWAEQYGMVELVPQLKAYLLRHRKEVATGPQAQEGLRSLAELNPELASELMLQLMVS